MQCVCDKSALSEIGLDVDLGLPLWSVGETYCGQALTFCTLLTALHQPLPAPLQFPNHSPVHPTSKGWVGGCGVVGAWGVEITFAYCSRRPNLGPLQVHHTQPLQFINVTNTNTSSTDAQWMRNLTNKPHNKKGTFFNLTHMSELWLWLKPCLCLFPCL